MSLRVCFYLCLACLVIEVSQPTHNYDYNYYYYYYYYDYGMRTSETLYQLQKIIANVMFRNQSCVLGSATAVTTPMDCARQCLTNTDCIGIQLDERSFECDFLSNFTGHAPQQAPGWSIYLLLPDFYY